MTLTTLVIGGCAASREAAIAAALTAGAGQDATTALILEGLPDGVSRFGTEQHSPPLNIIRIAPGCLCCTGNLIMRVTLNRLLRHPPSRLFVSLATATHREQIRFFLPKHPTIS
ncbi:GTPase [Undibacterium arcticum]|uniref:GTPase n=1 Tax=Undibacterium arcticum TaxID=1762892 RepID=UPI00360B7656